LVGDLGGWAIGLRSKDMCSVTKPRRRHRRHATKLTPAENTDGGARAKGGA
jgi:hypothetical protein